MTSFFIAPYEPTDDPSKWEELKTVSDLKIDPSIYKRQLLERWPKTEILKSSGSLQWCINTPSETGDLIPNAIGSLHSGQQVVSLDTPFEEFFLWHRSIVPDNYRLFLFNSSSWESFEVDSQTTKEAIKQFLGK